MTAIQNADRGPDYASQVMATYDAFAPWYDPMYRAQGRKPGAYRKEVVEAYAALFAGLGVRTILDCACGTGDPIIGLAQLPEFEVSGSDGSEAMLGLCARNAALPENEVAVHPWGTSRVSQGLQLAVIPWSELLKGCGDQRFDVVMCAGHAIYHLVTRQAIVDALRSMASITRPGGYVMFDTLRWTPGLRGEEGVEADVRFRGFCQEATGDRRITFLSSTHYLDDPAAVCGVMQLKRFFVLEEVDRNVQGVGVFDFYGAPFDEPAARETADAAGLTDIEVLHTDPDGSQDLVKRYMTVIGKKPG